MSSPYRVGWPLALRLGVMISIIVVVVALTIGATVIVEQRNLMRHDLEEDSRLLSRNIALIAPEAMRHRDFWTLYKVLKQTATAPSGERDGKVMLAMVLDASGTVMADLEGMGEKLGLPYTPPVGEEDIIQRIATARETALIWEEKLRYIDSIVPVFDHDIYAGAVRLRLNAQELNAQFIESANLVLALTFGLALIGSVVGAAMSVRLTRPLRELAAGMSRVGQGDAVAMAPPRGAEEIVLLFRAFKDMESEIAEKRRLEKEAAMNERLVAMGTVAAGIAHEVNSPLTGMINCVSLLKAHPRQPDIAERYIPLIEKGLSRIHSAIQSLLVDLRPVDATGCLGRACLDDIKRLIDLEITDNRVTLDWRNDVTDLATIDATRVQQIAINLLRNGLQAMPEGGRLCFHAYRDGDFLALDVTDSGVGMSADTKAHVLDPFFTTRPGGVGLGMWITHRLIKSLGGRIDIDSELGKGSRFRVRLPLNSNSPHREEAQYA